MEKPGSNGQITAKSVFSLNPNFLSLPHRILHVVNDDRMALEDKLPIKEEQGMS
jgi:hypothetical protein